jgi:hypothetical protein
MQFIINTPPVQTGGRVKEERGGRREEGGRAELKKGEWCEAMWDRV